MRPLNWKKWLKIIGIAFVVDIILCVAFVTCVLIVSQDYEIYPSEMGIVLMGDSANDYTDIGKQTRQRLNHSIKLYRQGYIKEFLCVGGSRPTHNYSGAQLMRQYLIDKGIPAEKIQMEQRSYDTVTNMSYTEEILRTQRPLRVVLISSPLHVFRIRALRDSRFLQGRFVFYSPHPFFRAEPAYTLWEMWKTIHYEWSSFAMRSLPQSWYDRIVREIRGQEDGL